MRGRLALSCGFCIVLVLAATGVTAQVSPPPIRHQNGQNVIPIFEGWYRTPDGTAHASFGYLNLNFAEELDVPIGPDNKIEPGAPDQGQPSHFLRRRHYGVFTVEFPKDALKSE